MAPHVLWLIVSHAILLVPAALLLDAGQLRCGLAVLVAVPALRIARRFDERKGYFIRGHSGSLAGSHSLPRPDLHITRRTRPLLFRAFLCIEIAVVAFVWSSIVRHPDIRWTSPDPEAHDVLDGDGSTPLLGPGHGLSESDRQRTP
jgi:hypothetical protein